LSSTHTRIARPAGARGVQHVEPRAVAVVDLEAEARRRWIISTSVSMIETSTPRASSDWLATWPKRPKPMISTLPVRPSAARRRRATARPPAAAGSSDHASGVSAIDR
jgi:hypothetical protein